jgi:hypothetical protein
VADVLRFELHVVCIDDLGEDLAHEEGWEALGEANFLEGVEGCLVLA